MASRRKQKSSDDIDAMIRELQEEKLAALKREADEDAESASLAARAVGELVFHRFEGDWRELDLAKLDGLLAEHGDALNAARSECSRTEEARKRNERDLRAAGCGSAETRVRKESARKIERLERELGIR